MKKTTILLTLAIIANTMLLSCSHDDSGNSTNERRDIVLTRGEETALTSQNEFAFNLFKTAYRQTSVDKSKHNFLLSPLSASTLLGILANGATNEALEEITQLLLPEGGDLESLNSLNKTLSSSLTKADKKTTLLLANSIWGDRDVKIGKNLIDNSSLYYMAIYQAVDMHNNSGRDAINNWVNNATNGLIPILFMDPPYSDFVIANALYFKGEWTKPFLKESTMKLTFTNKYGEKIKTDFMTGGTGETMYDENDSYSIVSLPYGNETFSMYAILPDSNSSEEEFISSLDSKKWDEIKNNMVCVENVNVKIPKFEVETTDWNMAESLQLMGLEKAFSKEGGFNGIIEGITFSNIKIFQKAVFSIDENGAKAAAVSYATLTSVSGESNIDKTKIYSSTFDRPFIYIVEEKSTGAMLFIGVIDRL